MYHYYEVLFCFGNSYSLRILNDCNTNLSYYYPGNNDHYALPEGMDKESEESKSFLAGSQSFKVQ